MSSRVLHPAFFGPLVAIGLALFAADTVAQQNDGGLIIETRAAETGRPLAGVAITITDLEGNTRKERTAADGSADFGRVVPGLYDVTAAVDGRVTVDGELEADRVFSDLMGKDPSARFQFIMEQAPRAEAVELDSDALARLRSLGYVGGTSSNDLELDPRLRDALADCGLVGQRLAEGDPRARRAQGLVQASAHHGCRAHTVGQA